MCNKVMKSISILLVAVALAAGAEASPRETFTVRTSKGDVVVENMLAGKKPSGKIPELKGGGFDVAPSIVGGSVVKNLKEFPQVVAIVSFDSLGIPHAFCTGVIIDKNVVFSAAHCFEDWTTDYYACSGVTDIHNAKKKEYRCGEILTAWTPNKYNHAKIYLGFDMAMLELSAPITSPYGKRVKVSLAKPKTGLASYSVGFGRHRSGRNNDGKMRKVAAKVVLNEGKCKTLNKTGLTHDSDLICARSNKATTCQGDSGGPLLVKTKKKNVYICVGTLSFGLKGCPRGKETVYSSLYDKDHRKLFKEMMKKVKGKYQTGKLPNK